MNKQATYHHVGVLFGCPTLAISATTNGDRVLTIERPVGESAIYPSAPWHRSYAMAEFIGLPIHRSWTQPMNRLEIELALIGQAERRMMEWPGYWQVAFQYPAGWSLTGNMNAHWLVNGYWEIESGIVI